MLSSEKDLLNCSTSTAAQAAVLETLSIHSMRGIPTREAKSDASKFVLFTIPWIETGQHRTAPSHRSCMAHDVGRVSAQSVAYNLEFKQTLTAVDTSDKHGKTELQKNIVPIKTSRFRPLQMSLCIATDDRTRNWSLDLRPSTLQLFLVHCCRTNRG